MSESDAAHTAFRPFGDDGDSMARLASIRVRTPDAGALARALAARGRACLHLAADTVRVHDITPHDLASLIADAGVVVYETMREHPSLDTVIGERAE